MLPSPSMTKHNGARAESGSLGTADENCSGVALMVLVGAAAVTR